MNEKNKRSCPLCGAEYTEPPATSRVDNKTPICPDCGTRQALEYLGVSREERERIVKKIRKYTGGDYEEDYTG